MQFMISTKDIFALFILASFINCSEHTIESINDGGTEEIEVIIPDIQTDTIDSKETDLYYNEMEVEHVFYDSLISNPTILSVI